VAPFEIEWSRHTAHTLAGTLVGVGAVAVTSDGVFRKVACCNADRGEVDESPRYAFQWDARLYGWVHMITSRPGPEQATLRSRLLCTYPVLPP
jgi:hypothetical protein